VGGSGVVEGIDSVDDGCDGRVSHKEGSGCCSVPLAAEVAGSHRRVTAHSGYAPGQWRPRMRLEVVKI
jgi:hypothetical protein